MEAQIYKQGISFKTLKAVVWFQHQLYHPVISWMCLKFGAPQGRRESGLEERRKTAPVPVAIGFPFLFLFLVQQSPQPWNLSQTYWLM